MFNDKCVRALVTDDLMMIEHKHRNPYPVRNCARLVVMSNSGWVVPAGKEARRFCVLDVGDGRMQDRRFFGALVRQMDDGGRAGLLHYLLNLDISRVDLGGAPRTAALMEQKIASFTPVESWWHDALVEGGVTQGSVEWDDPVSKELVYGAFRDHARNRGVRHLPGVAEFWTTLRGLAPGIRDTRSRSYGCRTRQMLFPPLAECRAVMENRLQGSVDWEGQR